MDRYGRFLLLADPRYDREFILIADLESLRRLIHSKLFWGVRSGRYNIIGYEIRDGRDGKAWVCPDRPR